MMNKEEFIKYVDETNESIREKLKDDDEALEFYSHLVVCFNRVCNESQKQKEVIDRILNETKETRNILNNNRDDNMLSKGCLLSYLGIVEDLLKEVSE